MERSTSNIQEDGQSEKSSTERGAIDSDSLMNNMSQYNCDKIPNSRTMYPDNGNKSSNNATSQRNNRKKDNHSKKEGKTAKILAIITGVFIVCWLPFFVLALVMPLCGIKCQIPDLVFSTFQWLGYVNSLLNPVIYTIFSRDFRNAFRKMLSPNNSNNNRV